VRFLKPLALAVYALLYAELFLRIFSPQAIMPRYVTGTEWGIRGNIPNATYSHWTPEVTVQYHINSQGMRADQDYPFAKPADTCRVAVYGDSFFIGYELPLADTFAARLEAGLRAQGIRAEVLNFSVSGFGQAEMLRSYESFGRKFDPDVVIFEWQTTDPDDNVRSDLYRLEDGMVKPGKAAYLPSIAVQDALMRWRLYRLIADNSQLYTFVRERAAVAIKRMLLSRRQTELAGDEGDEGSEADEAPAAEPGTAPQEARHDPGMDLSAALLLYAQQLMREEQRDFYVVSMPIRRSRTRFESFATRLPADARAQLTMIDPTDAFTRAARPDLKLFFEQGQGHITPEASEILTKDVLAVVARSPSFDGCRASLEPSRPGSTGQ
jgi:hypothetical protein